MNPKTTDAAQREEFFKNSFKGNFSYKAGGSSVGSFLKSMKNTGVPCSSSDKKDSENKKLYTIPDQKKSFFQS